MQSYRNMYFTLFGCTDNCTNFLSGSTNSCIVVFSTSVVALSCTVIYIIYVIVIIMSSFIYMYINPKMNEFSAVDTYM